MRVHQQKVIWRLTLESKAVVKVWLIYNLEAKLKLETYVVLLACYLGPIVVEFIECCEAVWAIT
jgi:hypothetical protein